MNYQEHNEEVRRVWSAYASGQPVRVPMTIGHNPRLTMWMSEANPSGTTFERYFCDPQVMLERQIDHQYWVRNNLPYDSEMGLPETGWNAYVDFQNTYEAAWFGCVTEFRGDQVPDTLPMLGDDNKRELFDRGLPDPFGPGVMARNWEFYDFLMAQRDAGWTRYDRPISSVAPNGLGTDGPVTLCCNLRGATEFLLDIMDDADYAVELMEFVTVASIERIKAYRQRLGQPERSQGFGFADDSIEMLSVDMYRELVLPFHRRLVEALCEPGAPVGIHLCGDAQRHFVTLRDELNVRSIDTGFPVDLGEARAELGPDVELLGGPSVPLLYNGTPEQVRAETIRVLQSGVTEGGRFVLREGNNLAPGTPVENIRAMYETVKQYGRYS